MWILGSACLVRFAQAAENAPRFLVSLESNLLLQEASQTAHVHVGCSFPSAQLYSVRCIVSAHRPAVLPNCRLIFILSLPGP